MPTRYSDEHHARTWPYPTDLAAFLARLGIDSTLAVTDAQMRVDIICMLPIGRLMPPTLRAELVGAGLLAPTMPRR